MIHRIVEGMPRRTEDALFAIGIVRDNIDAGDLGNFVHREVIISDIATRLRGETTAVPHDLSSTPHLINNASRMLHGHALLIELSALTTYHVEQDAKTVFLDCKMDRTIAPERFSGWGSISNDEPETFYGEYGSKDLHDGKEISLSQKNPWVKEIDAETYKDLKDKADKLVKEIV